MSKPRAYLLQPSSGSTPEAGQGERSDAIGHNLVLLFFFFVKNVASTCAVGLSDWPKLLQGQGRLSGFAGKKKKEKKSRADQPSRRTDGNRDHFLILLRLSRRAHVRIVVLVVMETARSTKMEIASGFCTEWPFAAICGLQGCGKDEEKRVGALYLPFEGWVCKHR